MKVSLKDTQKIDRQDFTARFYVDKEQRSDFNMIFVESLVGHYKTLIIEATRIYVVVEGQGEFEINERLFKAEPFDVFVIDSGQTYLYKGEMKLIEFNVPATDRSNYKKVERGANS